MKRGFINGSLVDPESWNNFNPCVNTFWEKTFNLNDCDFELNIDNPIFQSKKLKILFLIEPKEIISSIYEYVFSNKIADYIVTHHKSYVNNINIFYINPPTDTWINKNELNIYKKNKLCSMISSNKNYAIGHKLRWDIMQKYYNKIDLYGNGINPIKNKLDGLKDYSFSFAIENSSECGYYTEKIFDCFLTGTIPIYWGDPCIEDNFDTNGIIFYNDNFNLNSLSFDLYESKLEYIIKNYNTAKSLIKENHASFYITEGIKKIYEHV